MSVEDNLQDDRYQLNQCIAELEAENSTLRQQLAAANERLAASDVNGLAERIAEYAVAATHRYAMSSSDPEYLQRLKDCHEAKKQEMMPHIAELLAPLLADNERLRVENDVRFQMQAQRDEARAESERRLKLLVECRPYVNLPKLVADEDARKAERHIQRNMPDDFVEPHLREARVLGDLLTRIDKETGGK